MVEFVKGDTHGSKAVPPRFKDHTKLVCARHSRSGRKKYIKKHPERVRKVPSRKVHTSFFPAPSSHFRDDSLKDKVVLRPSATRPTSIQKKCVHAVSVLHPTSTDSGSHFYPQTCPITHTKLALPTFPSPGAVAKQPSS
jgi:hypothetical protein